MGEGTAHGVAVGARRSRARAYLAIARVSNLPTVWTNVLAGAVLSGVALHPTLLASIAAAVSLLYSAGMAFNDVMDFEHDVRAQPYRPLPSGELTRGEARWFGALLMAGGAASLVTSALMFAPRAPLLIVVLTVALCGAILFYDAWHKANPAGPLVIGLCRGLVYGCAAAAVAGTVSTSVLAGAAVMASYVIALTLVAKYAGSAAGWSISWLIAGICLVDAAMIAAAGAPGLALVAALGFPLTLAAQKLVRGT